ncbi:acidic fibroblast growth factor intracellular-binding protein isoform X1 [Acipenser oxyrinchus oxyrinchus]|uniref:Acidic fibroblast growth factor intracellular-binding protein isoform X1 n=1 Tax=Acipenser oxyrinchus oxyrinchus TaxID=40147 RepID=A0AAD8CQ94_ACIOX|nr:acidic fibroblast growth factor intracellular-binding protein isoform X1 [Acipenser oxyrinchus oxyrinchus]
MAMELDVFVGNTTIMDEDVYLLWLDGYTVSDAVSMRMKSGILEQSGASQDVLESDTMDHYRTFQMTERLLHNPSKLVNQLLFQIPPHRQNMLIERYYAFDEAFVREVLGKKLSKGTKKDLDDVSAKTGITLKSCRRQSRALTTMMMMRMRMMMMMMMNGLLSACFVSCRDYAAIVFFANSRFETGKKKLQYLTFEDFAFCAEQLIQNWTLGAVLQKFQPQLVFLLAFNTLSFFLPSLVCTALRGKLQVFNEMEGSFKNLSRGLVNIAGKLMNNKDVRDLFIDLVEKFIEPCKSDKWSLNDVRLFLTQHTNSVRALDAFKHQAVWERYMRVIQSCILKMYHD